MCRDCPKTSIFASNIEVSRVVLVELKFPVQAMLKNTSFELVRMQKLKKFRVSSCKMSQYLLYFL